MRRPHLIPVALALVAAFGGCADDAATGPDDPTTTVIEPTAEPTADSTPVTADSTPVTGATADSTPVTSVADPPDSDVLDPDEVAGLLWMREEEQLAHDVYVELGDAWGTRIFENIAASEQHHIDETIALLDRYGLDDPAAGNEPGTFTDPRIQELYDELVASGLESEVAALTAGATIEELDIADLRARAAATDEATIRDVYARLERASRNHLRAFVGQLELLGETYEPTVLDDVDEIVSSPMERGRDG